MHPPDRTPEMGNMRRKRSKPARLRALPASRTRVSLEGIHNERAY
jgi:hypothetical protein